MNLPIVSYEVAKDLRELGFNWFPDHDSAGNYYTKDGDFIKQSKSLQYNNSNSDFYLAPTQAEAVKWFRDVHNIEIEAYRTMENSDGDKYGCQGTDWSTKDPEKHNLFNLYGKTYEAAELEGIKEAIEILKERKQL